MERFYFAIIPANVRYDVDLSPNAKLLYGEITALCNERGFCWATNSYFANLYNVKKETISRWISQLEKKQYIKTQLIYKENSQKIKERRLYISEYPIDEKVNTLLTKKSIPYCENNQYPIDEKVKDNNTMNSTLNNTMNIKEDTKKINYKQIVNSFNSICKSYPKVNKLSEARKKTIKARFNNGYDYQDFINLFEMAEQSEFLKGENNRSWQANFDWLIKDANFAKVLDGNYSNKKNKNVWELGEVKEVDIDNIF